MAWEKFKFAETDTTIPANILVVDELAAFVEGATNDPKSRRQADKFQDNLSQIARLGRNAHIHLVLATQTPSGNLFPSDLKNNIAQRFICGHVEANISRMAIDSEEGEALPNTVGTYLSFSKGDTQQFQGWYTSTKDVLSFGTIKPGYDPKEGTLLESEDDDDFDLSKPIEEDNNDMVLSFDEQEEAPQEIQQEIPQEIQQEAEVDNIFDKAFDEVQEEPVTEETPAPKFKINAKEQTHIKLKVKVPEQRKDGIYLE